MKHTVFANDIQFRRKIKGLSQKQLSIAVGLERSELSRIENGTVIPHNSTREKIEKELGVKIDWVKMRMQGHFSVDFLENESPEERVSRDIVRYIKSGQLSERKRRFTYLRKFITHLEKSIK